MPTSKKKRSFKMDSAMLETGHIRASIAIKASLISTTHLYRLMREDKVTHTAYGKLKYVLISSLAQYLGQDASDLFRANLVKKYGEPKVSAFFELTEKLEARL